MLRHIAALSMLCLVFAGCRPAGPEWVIGSSGVVSTADTHDGEAARSAAARYVSAWIDKDYVAMFDLQCKRATADYSRFHRLAVVWRTKGFPQQAALASEGKQQIAATMTPLLGVTEPQAQILLAVATSGRQTLEQIKRKRWPERVMFLKVVIGSDRSVLMLAKEKGSWTVLNAPGTLGPDMLSPNLREQLSR